MQNSRLKPLLELIRYFKMDLYTDDEQENERNIEKNIRPLSENWVEDSDRFLITSD